MVGMAEHLSSIFGTEKDRVNCPFYFKIGVCRHGDRCSRLHTKPTISPTLLLSNMYQRPHMLTPGVDTSPKNSNLDPRKVQDHFEYEENVCSQGGYCNFMHPEKINRELRRRLFGRSRHRHSRSRNPHKHPSHKHCAHGSRGSGRREDDRERHHHDRDRQPRSCSPGHGRTRHDPWREEEQESSMRKQHGAMCKDQAVEQGKGASGMTTLRVKTVTGEVIFD